MELRHLRYFIAVAECGSFHRASGQLNVAQPTLSRQIRDLEQELGTPLLVRSTQGVQLSPAGEALLQQGKWLLPAIELAKTKAKRAAMGQFGLVRVAFNSLVAEFRAVIAGFADAKRSLPELDFRLSMISSEGQIAAIDAGEIDVGVLYHRPPYPPGVRHRDLLVESYVLAVPEGHPLASRPAVRLADLQDYDMAFVSRSALPVVHEELLLACWRGGLSPRIVVEVQSEAGVVNIVSEGLAISLASSTLAQRRPTPGLVLLPIEDLEIILNLAVMWRADRETPATLTLVDRLSYHVRSAADRG
jgi:DNA-binding transcriptional LysR family regulator